MEYFKKLHTCCFTGHRPEKLNMTEKEVKDRLRKAIRDAIQDGFTTFITGMARGVDIWSAEIVLEERKSNDQIMLICVPPFEGFEKSWGFAEKNKYKNIVKKADFVKYICVAYSKKSFQMRNCYMVDNSSRIISVYNGEKGGTQNTIKYAKTKKIEVINVLLKSESQNF